MHSEPQILAGHVRGNSKFEVESRNKSLHQKASTSNIELNVLQEEQKLGDYLYTPDGSIEAFENVKIGQASKLD